MRSSERQLLTVLRMVQSTAAATCASRLCSWAHPAKPRTFCRCSTAAGATSYSEQAVCLLGAPMSRPYCRSDW